MLLRLGDTTDVDETADAMQAVKVAWPRVTELAHRLIELDTLIAWSKSANAGADGLRRVQESASTTRESLVAIIGELSRVANPFPEGGATLGESILAQLPQPKPAAVQQAAVEVIEGIYTCYSQLAGNLARWALQQETELGLGSVPAAIETANAEQLRA